jgi:hypothetical protein
MSDDSTSSKVHRVAWGWYYLLCSSAQTPSVFLLTQQRRVVAGSDLSIGPCTTIKKVRCAASSAAGNGLGNTIKYLRRTRKGAAGNGLGTTIMYLRQTTATTIMYRALFFCCDSDASPQATVWAPRSSTCLDVYFSRNVKKSTISTSEDDFFSESQEDHAVLIVLFGGLQQTRLTHFFLVF